MCDLGFRLSYESADEVIEQNRLSLAEVIVEKAAFYDERLKGREDDISREHWRLFTGLSNDYLNLRITLVGPPGMLAKPITEQLEAWLQGRLDLAKLTLATVDFNSLKIAPSSAQTLADTLFEIGKSQNRKSLWSEATYWLGRAYDMLSTQDSQALSSNVEDLQIATMHELARAFINEGGEEKRAKAMDIINKLDIECGDRLVVLLLKLDAFALDPERVPRNYSDVLHAVVHQVHLTDTNIKTVLYHVHKLRAWSPSMAHDVLTKLLLQRLVEAGRPRWVEKVFVTLIWNSTTSRELCEVPDLLAKVLDSLQSTYSQVLCPSATHAAQVVGPINALWCSS